MVKRILALSAIVLAFFWAGSALAGQATDLVRSKQAELFKTLRETKSDAREAKLKAIFDDMIAYDVFCKRSLGDKWDTLTSDQQQEFCGVLTDLVRENYRKNIHKLLDFEVTYAGETVDGDAVLVKTTNKHKTDPNEPDIEVVFRVESKDDPRKVTDIITERASMVKTYRSQFLRVLRDKGYDQLIHKMKKKLRKVRKQNQ